MSSSPSSSTSRVEQVRALISRKDGLEQDISAQFSILQANNATLHTPPLVDSEGFPRADIDVYAVRHARVKIIELKNDLRSVMDEIARGLEGGYDPSLTDASDVDGVVGTES